uniref:PDC sensor domain-containing protein n=1 Tax=uncultured Campylobacter sp. TaxID=218934 RepID=UPI0026127055
MFSRLSIGSKIMFSVGFAVILGLVVLTYIISSQVSKNMIASAEKVIQAEVESYTAFTNGSFREVGSLVNNISTILSNIFHSNDIQNISLQRISDVISSLSTSSTNTHYSFFYIPNAPEHLKTNPTFQTESGNTIILFEDKEGQGKATPVQANDSFMDFSSIKYILDNTKDNNKVSSITIGKPRERSFAGHTFVGLPIVMPVYDAHGKLIGIVGSIIDFEHIRLNVTSALNFEGEMRALLYKDGTIAFHSVKEYSLKKLFDIIDKDKNKETLQAMIENKSGIFDYQTSMGVDSYLALHSFNIDNTDSTWMMLVAVPKSVVLQELTNLQIMLVVTSFIITIIIIALVWYMVRKTVSSRLPTIVLALERLFKYINHEINTIEPIKIRAQDELGKIGIMINENAKNTQKDLEKDAALVKESLEVINHARGGHATKRITLQGSNPALNQLKDSVNQLLELLATAIGTDLPELNRVFDSFVKLDFSTEVKNAKGRVEVVTNTLGDEIRKMLQTSASYANQLSTQANELKVSMQKLTEGSKS